MLTRAARSTIWGKQGESAAHRDAAAKETSPGHAPTSHTQLLPASGPSASASHFPARDHPFCAKRQRCREHADLLAVEPKTSGRGPLLLAPHPSSLAAGNGASTADQCAPGAVEPPAVREKGDLVERQGAMADRYTAGRLARMTSEGVQQAALPGRGGRSPCALLPSLFPPSLFLARTNGESGQTCGRSRLSKI